MVKITPNSWFTPVLFLRRSMSMVWCIVLGLVISGMVLIGSLSFGEDAAQPKGPSGKIEWIDVHNHLIGGRAGRLQDYPGAVRTALEAMDKAGISKMVVMPPPQVYGDPPPSDYDSFVTAIKQHPTRLAFLGGGGSLNAMLQQAGQETTINESLRGRFEAKALEILKQGGLGFGEITAHHLSHMADHPYESVAADHPLLLLLADIAARYEVVIDFHLDLVVQDMKSPKWLSSPPNPPVLTANLAAFERLLEHNRKAKIVWAHAGSDTLGYWTTDLSRRLLEKHPNLYMSLRMGPGRAPENHPLTPAKEIKPEWLRLLQDFPDRFVLGGDQFFPSPLLQGKEGPGLVFAQRAPAVRERTRAFLEVLPPHLARKIGYENAIRLYQMKPPRSELRDILKSPLPCPPRFAERGRGWEGI